MEVLNQIFLFCNLGLGKMVLLMDCVFPVSKNYIHFVFLSSLRNLAELVFLLTD